MADYILTNPKAPLEEREETEQQKSERQQQQPAQLSPQQQELANIQNWYNDFVDKNGSEPDDETLTRYTSGKAYALRPAIKAKYGKDTRVRAGGMFTLANDAVRRYFNEGYAEHKKNKEAQAIQARAFTPRVGGVLQVPQGTAIYGKEGGVQYTQQDLNALKAWMVEPKSPERDAAIVGALESMGIHLPTNGTLEKRLSDYVKNPLAFEGLTEEEEKNLTPEQKEQALGKFKANADALVDLLDYAGATMNNEGNYVMPEKYTEEQKIRQRWENYVNEQKAERDKQEAAINRERAMKGLSELASIFGNMIKATGGAKVFPRDLSKAYDALDARQQKLYDRYYANLENERQRLEAENVAKQKQAHDDAEAEKARDWKTAEVKAERDWRWQQAKDEREWKSNEAALDRDLNWNKAVMDNNTRKTIYETKTEQNDYVIDLGNVNGKDYNEIKFNKSVGASKYNQVFEILWGAGLVPIELFDPDANGNPRKYPNLNERKGYVEGAARIILNRDDVDPAVKEKIFEILTGEKVEFEDKRTKEPEEQVELAEQGFEGDKEIVSTRSGKYYDADGNEYHVIPNDGRYSSGYLLLTDAKEEHVYDFKGHRLDYTDEERKRIKDAKARKGKEEAIKEAQKRAGRTAASSTQSSETVKTSTGGAY